MDTYATHAPTQTARRFGLCLLLLLGPVLSVEAARYAAGSTYLPADLLGYVLIAALLLWSPAPISLPAVLLSDARDGFRTGAYGIRRSIALYPYLLSRSSGVRVPTTVHLIGFTLATMLAVATVI